MKKSKDLLSWKEMIRLNRRAFRLFWGRNHQMLASWMMSAV